MEKNNSERLLSRIKIMLPHIVTSRSTIKTTLGTIINDMNLLNLEEHDLILKINDKLKGSETFPIYKGNTTTIEQYIKRTDIIDALFVFLDMETNPILSQRRETLKRQITGFFVKDYDNVSLGGLLVLCKDVLLPTSASTKSGNTIMQRMLKEQKNAIDISKEQTASVKMGKNLLEKRREMAKAAAERAAAERAAAKTGGSGRAQRTPRTQRTQRAKHTKKRTQRAKKRTQKRNRRA